MEELPAFAVASHYFSTLVSRVAISALPVNSELLLPTVGILSEISHVLSNG